MTSAAVPANTVPAPLPAVLIRDAVRAALAEDLGLAGDVTTDATIPADAQAAANFRVRADGVVSGLAIAAETFRTLDPAVRFEARVNDGAWVARGDVLATVSGPARAILTGERVALNYLADCLASLRSRAPTSPPLRTPRRQLSTLARRHRA